MTLDLVGSDDRQMLRLLSTIVVLFVVPARAQDTPSWASSPSNAWLADKPIPESLRKQLKMSAPDAADTHAVGSFLAVTTPAGMTRLKRSSAKEDYWVLSTTFETQSKQSLCSVASAVTILNALPLSRPIDETYRPFPYFTQATYFTEPVTRIRTLQKTTTDGMTLPMVALALGAHGAVAKVHHASDLSVADFRRTAVDNLKREGDFLLVNYQRAEIGQPTGAHFSPVGAYDDKSDTFLIMDVARYKFPPVWVRAEDLYKAISGVDAESGRTRGFLSVARK